MRDGSAYGYGNPLNSIAIITVSYNSADTLKGCLRSVQSQSVSVAHLIIDGGSADESHAIIDAHREHLHRVLIEPDQGIYDAINKGIENSESEIVGILHADDMFANDTVIERILAEFSDSKVDAVYGDLDFVNRDDKGTLVRRWKAGGYTERSFYNGWMPPHPTFFVRRSCFERFGNYRLDLGTAADYELMLRFLLRHGIRTKYIPEVLVKMRTGGVSNASFKNRIQANRMDRKAWEVNNLKPKPWTLIVKPLRKAGQWWVK